MLGPAIRGGRFQSMLYPVQATVSAHDGWIRGMSYDTSGVTGDLGTVYAADESGGIIKLMPDALWDEDAQRYVHLHAAYVEVYGHAQVYANAHTTVMGSKCNRHRQA